MRWPKILSNGSTAPRHRRSFSCRARFRSLLIEQLEDRRVLAQAVGDSYEITANGTLLVGGYGTWGNDSYNASWSETQCGSSLQFHEGYWEDPVWYPGHYDDNDEWHDGYY